MSDKPKIGDHYYMVNEGGTVRATPQKPRYVKVSKVGRKYLTITSSEYPTEMQFELDSLTEKADYGSNWTLYKSELDYAKEIELARLRKVFYTAFSGYGKTKYTLEQYQQAAEIFGLE